MNEWTLAGLGGYNVCVQFSVTLRCFGDISSLSKNENS